MAVRPELPPIRTLLAEQVGAGAEQLGMGRRTSARPNSGLTATREYWLYWNDLNLLVKAQGEELASQGDELAALEELVSKALTAGPHADRVAADPAAYPPGALWTETDRNNLVYQVETVAGAPAWVYVTGAMYGTIISTDQRPTGLGANDTGLVFISSDSSSVRWMGSNWVALGRIIDIGASPSGSQLVVKAAGQGALSFLTFASDNAQLGFDVELNLPSWTARGATCAWITKTGDALIFLRSSGNTPGSPIVGQNEAARLNLTTGAWSFQAPSSGFTIDLAGSINVSTSYQVAGAQVLKARQPAVTPPTGGTVVDAQARASIIDLIDRLRIATGHGLIAG